MARTTNVKKKKTKKTRARRKYSPEFKENAVKLAMTGDTTIAAVARDLGIHEKSLYEWTSKAKERERKPRSGSILRWDTKGSIVSAFTDCAIDFAPQGHVGWRDGIKRQMLKTTPNGGLFI